MKMFTQIYDFHDDVEKIAAIQSAAKAGRGMKITHGVIGSDVWWQSIDAGRLERRSCEGSIISVDGGPMGDWPTMRIRCSDGEVHSWTACGPVDSSAVGRFARVDYVEQEPINSPYDGFTVRVVLGVWIEE